MTDVGSTPQTPQPDLNRPSALPQSTKPRQMPGGGSPAMPGSMPGAPTTFDPTTNGATLTAPPAMGAEPVTDDPVSNPDTQPVTDDNSPRVAALTAEVIRDNPGIAPRQARRIAERAFSEYLAKEAKDLEPPERPETAAQERVEGQGEPLPPRGPSEPETNREGVL